MHYGKELRAAIEAARAAGQIILTAYETFVAIPDARADITTDADRQSQEAILKHLQAVFPQDALCAEENTPTLAGARQESCPTASRSLTRSTAHAGFAQKNGEFSVMIGLRDGERIVVGVVLEPAKQRLTYAVVGDGCWQSRRRRAIAANIPRFRRRAKSPRRRCRPKPLEKPRDSHRPRARPETRARPRDAFRRGQDGARGPR